MAIAPSESSSDAAVVLYILRFPAILRDHQFVDLSSEKATALLGFLALSSTPQAREQLQALMWPESSEAAARKNLRNLLWQIAGRCGHVISAEGKYLRLGEAVQTDAAVFEEIATHKETTLAEMRAALFDLYHCPPLDTLRSSNMPQFELWLTLQQERFGRLHDTLTNRLLAHYRHNDDWKSVIDVALRALQVGQWQESTYAALIEGYARLGERAKALAMYEQLRRWLAREHGLTPSEDSQNLLRLIRNGTLRQTARCVVHTERPHDVNSRITQQNGYVWDTAKDISEDTPA
jgi:pentatricopeptide repeat protein